MAQRIAVDPITRIEGHLRIEAQLEGGKIAQAWSSSTAFRRITSYNVCYTKLLRDSSHRRVGGRRQEATHAVITSYSIHYTKLYEGARRHGGGAATGHRIR